jgi:hypothetical protein
MRALDEETAARLVKIVGMFGSSFDGERANAARLADTLVRQLGLTWSDVIAFVPAWQTMVRACRDQVHRLNEREANFILSANRWRRGPTEKQYKWLVDIHNRLQRNRS